MVNIHNYNRIAIIGNSGSGKSWLSKQIAKLTGHPLYHLDNEFWKPDWVMTPRDERITRLNEIMRGEQWIIDGNYDSSIEMRLAAADLTIFLDINRLVCIVSILRRHGKKRSDLPNYLDEPSIFRKEVLEFLKWVWSYPKTGRKTVVELREKYPDKTFLHIKTRREATQLVKNRSARKDEKPTDYNG